MPEKKIDAAIHALIERDRDYIYRPVNRGGPTHYGINQHTLTQWIGRDATIRDVRDLSKKQAFDIIYTFFYLGPNIDNLPFEIQPIMLDMAVIHRPWKAVFLLQDALIGIGISPGQTDGILGPRTAQAARRAVDQLDDGFIKILIDRRIDFYRSMVRASPRQQASLPDWIGRAQSFLPA